MVAARPGDKQMGKPSFGKAGRSHRQPQSRGARSALHSRGGRVSILLAASCLVIFAVQLAAAPTAKVPGPAMKKDKKPAAAAKVPKSFIATVRVVLSGDTFQANYNGRRVIVQFDAVDAPERGQPHSEAARNSLAAKIQGKVVRVEPVRGDFDGGFIARVWLEKRSVNKQMVADGLAWHLPDVRSKALDKAEARAKETRAGLWRSEAPLPPWEYRAKLVADAVANGEEVDEGAVDGETRVKPLPLAKKPGRARAGGAAEAEVREAAERFLAAAKKGDKAKVKESLTEKSRKSFDSQPFALDGANTSYTIDQVQVEKQQAQVAVRFEVDGSTDNADLHLRREDGRWRVFGLQMAAKGNEQAIALNFEQPGGTLDNLGGSAADVALASVEDNAGPVRLDSDTRKRLKKGGLLEKLDPKIEQLLTEYRRALEEFAVMIKSARDVDTLQSLFDAPQNPFTRFAPQFLDVARGAPKSAAGFQALCIVCEMMIYDRSRKGPDFLTEARDLLATNHLKTDDLLLPIVFLILHPREANIPFFERVLEECPNKLVKGCACLAVATSLMGTEKEGLDAYADSTELIRLIEERKTRDDRIIAMLERTTSEFGKLELGETTLAKIAEPMLFERKFLMVGKVAPDIVGKDIDGKPLKLSDHRGKVVIVDFWVDWCPHCVRMYPHERLMLQKYADKPFAILGVNCDTRERYQQVLAQRKVTWPSFYDGPGGPIAERWNVEGYPTVYVLNADGVIFYKDWSIDGLERAVETLIRNPHALPGPNPGEVRVIVPPAAVPPAAAGASPSATVPPAPPPPATQGAGAAPAPSATPAANGPAVPSNSQATGAMRRSRGVAAGFPSGKLAFARGSDSRTNVEDFRIHGRFFIDTFFRDA